MVLDCGWLMVVVEVLRGGMGYWAGQETALRKSDPLCQGDLGWELDLGLLHPGSVAAFSLESLPLAEGLQVYSTFSERHIVIVLLKN